MTGEDGESSGEERLIETYFAPLADAPGALNLTDDAACFSIPSGQELVLTKDAIVAGTHFLPDDPPDTIARKALRVNLSDLAAKGAEPAGFLLALGLPSLDPVWLKRFSGALGEDARAFGCPLLGGDTVKTSGPLFVSITALGSLPNGTMVKRSGAQPDDAVFVSGTIGDAALGLAVLRERFASWPLDSEAASRLLQRYRVPQPRTALAGVLRGAANAAMDVSDGLAGDLRKLCRASGVSAEIKVEDVPLSRAARTVLGAAPDLLDTVLGGGDDYEILCAVPPARVADFQAAALDAKVEVTRIGRIVAGEGPPRFYDAQGRLLQVARGAFSHF